MIGDFEITAQEKTENRSRGHFIHPAAMELLLGKDGNNAEKNRPKFSS